MVVHELELGRHHELAEFLRNRRSRLTPEQFGLPRGTRRRTPGLRRGEVAMLAGVSPEWYTWLEQGRDINVSVQVLESLARVLQLNENERTHLFLLAVRQPPPIETFTSLAITPVFQQFLEGLGTTPACVVDARLNVVGWNKAHSLVFGDFAQLPVVERNLIRRLFSIIAQQVNHDWEQLASIYLAQFRAGYGKYVDDPWWANQIAELSESSPEFRRLWARQDVVNISEGRKTMNHQVAGELKFNFIWFQTVDSSEHRLLIHTPNPATDTAEKIERLFTTLYI